MERRELLADGLRYLARMLPAMVSSQPHRTSYQQSGFAYFLSQQEPPRNRFIRVMMALPIQAEEN